MDFLPVIIVQAIKWRKAELLFGGKCVEPMHGQCSREPWPPPPPTVVADRSISYPTTHIIPHAWFINDDMQATIICNN